MNSIIFNKAKAELEKFEEKCSRHMEDFNIFIQQDVYDYIVRKDSIFVDESEFEETAARLWTQFQNNNITSDEYVILIVRFIVLNISDDREGAIIKNKVLRFETEYYIQKETMQYLQNKVWRLESKYCLDNIICSDLSNLIMTYILSH